MPNYDQMFADLEAATSFGAAPSPANEEHWRKRLAGQGQFKAPPPKPVWRRFMESIEEGMRRGPASLIASTIAPLVETGDDQDYQTRRRAFAQQEKQRRADYDVVNQPENAVDYAADIGGSIVGSLISDPTNLIGGPSKALGEKLFTAAGLGAGSDLALQGAEVAGDMRDKVSQEQVLINAAASPIFAAASHGIGRAWDRYGPKRADADTASEGFTPEEDSIDRRLRGLDDLANHPDTPKHEAAAARRMAEKLRTKYGKTTPEAADTTPARANTGPITIADAADAVKGFGTVTSTVRSAARNKKVGGVKNSFHLSGRALDIARKAGVSHREIEAALRRAGYNIVESIDEGDHSHFAFDFNKPSDPELVVDGESVEVVDNRHPDEILGEMIRSGDDDPIRTRLNAALRPDTIMNLEGIQNIPDGPATPAETAAMMDLTDEIYRATPATHSDEQLTYLQALDDAVQGYVRREMAAGRDPWVNAPGRSLAEGESFEQVPWDWEAEPNVPEWRQREIDRAARDMEQWEELNNFDEDDLGVDEDVDLGPFVDDPLDMSASPINQIVNPLHPLAARQSEVLQELYLRNPRYGEVARARAEGRATPREHDAVAREVAYGLGMGSEYDELFPFRDNEPSAYSRYEERTGRTIGPLTRMAVENVASNRSMDLDRAARMYIRGLSRDTNERPHPFVAEVRDARDALAEMTMTPSEFEAYKALPNNKQEDVQILDDLPENVVEFPQSRIVGSTTKPRLIIQRIEPEYGKDYLVVVGQAHLTPEMDKMPDWRIPSFRMTIDKKARKANIDIYGQSTNELGPVELRALAEQIAKRFPYIDSIGGFRVTGARGQAGKPAANSVPIGKLRDKKPQVPEVLPENVLRINQKELDRLLQDKKAAMEEAEQRQTTQLNNLLATLDNIYDSVRKGEVFMTPSEVKEMRDESFVDNMIRQLDGTSFPKGTTAIKNEDTIREIAARFDEIDTTMEGIAKGEIPIVSKPKLSVIEGGKKDSLVSKVTDTVKEIINNDEGVFRPFGFFSRNKGGTEGPEGRGDPKYYVDTPEGAPEATRPQGALDLLFQAVRNAKKASPEQAKARAAERSERVKELLRRRQHTSGISGLKSEKSALKGELPKIDLEPIRDQFTPEMIDSIMDDIKASRKLSPLESVRVRDAVDELLNGKLPTKGELSLIYRVYPELVDAIMTKRGWDEKVKGFIRQLWETPRGSMGSGDVSFSGRQGFMMLSRPEWWKATFKQFQALPETKGKQVLDEQTERIVNHPLYYKLKKMGIELMDVGGHGNRDEFAVQNLAEMKYSPTKHIVKGSNRAYTFMSNELRPGLALAMLEKHRAKGVDIDDPHYLKTLGEYINTFTGRGKFNNKTIDRAMPALNILAFAPRFVLSTFKRFSPFLWAKMLRHPAILKEAARDSGAYLLTLFGTLALADHLGYEVEYDIRSPTGLKIKHGNTTYDVGAGLIQTASLLSKIATDTKITGKGEEKDLRDPDYGEDNLFDVVSRFARTKFHPMLAYLVDAKVGTNVVGEEFDVLKDTGELFMPMYSMTMAEHINEVGPEGAAAALPAAFGVGMNTFKPRKAKEKKEPDPYDKMFKDLEGDQSVDELEKFLSEQGL